MEKIKILPQSPDPKDETAHLRPVIEFIKTQGNSPENKDQFEYDLKDGFKTYTFKLPIDRLMIEKKFEFPDTIAFVDNRTIHDKKNLIEILS